MWAEGGGAVNFQSCILLRALFEGRTEGPGASSRKDFFPLFGLESGWVYECFTGFRKT